MKDFEQKDIIRCWGVYIPEEAGKEVTQTLKSTWINTGKKELQIVLFKRVKIIILN